MKKALMTLAILLFAIPAWAGPYLACDYYTAADAITSCELEVNATVQAATIQTDANGTRIHHDLATWQNGTYSVRARCSNQWGVSPYSAVFSFTKAAPQSPANLGIRLQ